MSESALRPDRCQSDASAAVGNAKPTIEDDIARDVTGDYPSVPTNIELAILLRRRRRSLRVHGLLSSDHDDDDVDEVEERGWAEVELDNPSSAVQPIASLRDKPRSSRKSSSSSTTNRKIFRTYCKMFVTPN